MQYASFKFELHFKRYLGLEFVKTAPVGLLETYVTVNTVHSNGFISTHSKWHPPQQSAFFKRNFKQKCDLNFN